MDNSPAAFKSFVQSAFVPLVVVLCTAGVEKICQKQGIKFVDAFKQATWERRRLPIRFGENSYDLQDLRVRFVELKDLEKQDDSKLAAQLANEIDDVAVDTCSDISTNKLRDKADIPRFLKSLTMPWYEKYKLQFAINSSPVEHEFFHHPIACIIAASSEDSNPIGALVKLFDPNSPPSIFGESYVEASIPKTYIYVYTSEQPREAADKRLSEIKNTLPSTTSYLLKAEALSDPASPPSTKAVDSSISLLLSDLMAKSIAPYLEKHMAELNEIITSNKKGFFQKIVKMKFVKGTTTGSDADANANSNVGEIASRKLGDILFFLQDYETASTFYRNCTKEFNNEKTWNYYAATQEMIGLCFFLLGRDTTEYLDNAYLSYQKSGQYRYAIRSTFFNGDILKIRGNAKAAADVFIRGSEKDCDMFCSALFSEQAAFCYLMTTPVSFHKFCFRMVMAATRFQEGGKRKHARRAYEMAYNVYEGRNWGAVEDQLHQSFVKIAYSLGKMDEAITFAQKLLVKNSLPFQKQNSLVREFLYICKTNTKPNDPMPIVPLPIVANDSIKVHLHDYSDTDSAEWDVLETGFRIEADTQKANTRQGFDLWKVKEEDDLVNKERVVVSEEYVTVEVDVKNPLQVPLQFTHVHLVGTYTEPSNATANPIHTFQFSFPEFVNFYTRSPSTTPLHTHTLPFRVEPFDILLGPSESKKLTFAVQPLKAGQLELKGLGLYMCGAAWGRREFNLKPRRLNRTAQQKKSVVHEPNRCLTFKVTDPMPRLEVLCVNFPETLYRGELRQAGLRLRNCSGKMGLKNVRVRSSHPNAVLFVPLGSTATTSSNPRREGESVLLDVELAPGAEVVIPVWLHFSSVPSASSVTMRFLFYYESEVGNNDLKYRLARCSATIAVRPALALKTATHPAPSDLDAYLLHLELSNIDNLHTVTIQQITSISNFWKIEPLSLVGGDTDIPQDIFTLKPGQSSNTFFRIKRIPSTTTDHLPRNQQLPFQSCISVSNSSRKPVSAMTFPFFDFLEKDKHPESVEVTGGKLGTSGSGLVLGQLPPPTFDEVEDTNKVDILLFWESGPSVGGGTRLYGQLSIPNVTVVSTHHAAGIDLISRRSVRTPSSATITLSSPSRGHLPLDPLKQSQVAVRFLVESASHVAHDFNAHGLCVVPLQLHIANCSNHAPLTFDLLTLSPQEGDQGGREGDKAPSHYLWCGTTTYHVDNLEPQGKITLSLSACFFKPGVYNLTRFKLTVQGPNNSTTVIHAPFQHLVTIQEVAQ